MERLKKLIKVAVAQVGTHIKVNDSYYIVAFWEERPELSKAVGDKFLKREDGKEYWLTLALCDTDTEVAVSMYSPIEDEESLYGYQNIASDFFPIITNE